MELLLEKVQEFGSGTFPETIKPDGDNRHIQVHDLTSRKLRLSIMLPKLGNNLWHVMIISMFMYLGLTFFSLKDLVKNRVKEGFLDLEQLLAIFIARLWCVNSESDILEALRKGTRIEVMPEVIKIVKGTRIEVMPEVIKIVIT